MSVALITGITGQDGSYLAELLLAKGYEVHGIIRRSSSFNTGRIDHLYSDVHQSPALRLHYGDLGDGTSLRRILSEVQPTEVYNLAAQSHVRVSFDQPEFTADVGGLGCLRLLEAIRDVNPRIRFYQASSSEMYGNASREAMNETTPFDPRSPYAAAKVFAFHVTANYREAYDMFACNGILFNHESPRRGETFVTRKVTRAATRIKVGLQQELFLGNLDAKRDWGFAGDYVDAMWRMVQAEKPADYVIGTGEAHSVRELCETAFGLLGLDYQRFVKIDPRYFRPTEVDHLLADSTRARRELGWKPQVLFTDLVRMMVESDLELAKRELRADGRPVPADAQTLVGV
ncbi:MAG: GDP-mannose 4,6-dehydratase [Planctomycetia bacterium]|nr:MAG: GDP-mannose 4,6-dehydratase [Planctomycetia bacterium]